MTLFYSTMAMAAKELSEDSKEAAKRLADIFSINGWEHSEVASKLGYERSIVNKYVNAKQKISDQFLRRLQENYRVSRNYILTGIKPEYISLTTQFKQPKNNIYNEADPISLIDESDVSKTWSGGEFRDLDDGKVLMTIPLVDEFAYASYLSGWKDAEYIEDLPKHSIVVDKRHTGKYRAFRVRGDSMDNDRREAIGAGDIVVGRSIEKRLWNSKFHLHRFVDYVIVHQEGIVIKRISKQDVEHGIITCTSLNTNKEAYPDFDVNLADVYEIYNIISVEQKRGV